MIYGLPHAPLPGWNLQPKYMPQPGLECGSNHLSHSGWAGSFILNYRQHVTMVPTQKPMVTLTRGLGKEKRSRHQLCTSSRETRGCSRFLIALLLLKMKQDNDNDNILVSWNCQISLRCCYKVTRHGEIFQIYYTSSWSSVWQAMGL